jgi:U3 small nucleolar RNA-associated protein 13
MLSVQGPLTNINKHAAMFRLAMHQQSLCISPQDTEPITALAVSPDCKTLVAASRSLSVKVWDITTGECVRTWKVRTLQPVVQGSIWG